MEIKLNLQRYLYKLDNLILIKNVPNFFLFILSLNMTSNIFDTISIKFLSSCLFITHIINTSSNENSKPNVKFILFNTLALFTNLNFVIICLFIIDNSIIIIHYHKLLFNLSNCLLYLEYIQTRVSELRVIYSTPLISLLSFITGMIIFNSCLYKFVFIFILFLLNTCELIKKYKLKKHDEDLKRQYKMIKHINVNLLKGNTDSEFEESEDDELIKEFFS